MVSDPRVAARQPPEQGHEHRVGAVAVRPQLHGARQVGRLRVGRLRDQREGVLEPDVGSVGQDRLDHSDRLFHGGRAGGVEDHPAGPDESSALCSNACWRGTRSRRSSGYAASGSPVGDAGRPDPCMARRPAPGRRCPRPTAAGCRRPRRRRRWSLAGHRRRASRGAVVARWPAAARRARSPARRAVPPSRRDRRTGPASARPNRRPRPGRARVRPAATRHPGPRPARHGLPGIAPGPRLEDDPERRERALHGFGERGSQLLHRRSPGLATSVTRGRALFGGQQRLPARRAGPAPWRARPRSAADGRSAHWSAPRAGPSTRPGRAR